MSDDGGRGFHALSVIKHLKANRLTALGRNLITGGGLRSNSCHFKAPST